jgi:hypothetical protein
MKLTLAILCWFALACNTTLAQSENKVIKDDDMKIQFTVPEGWQATKKGNSYLMGSSNTKGFMLIEVQEFKSLKKLKSSMEGGIELEDGSKLMPAKELANLGKLGVSGLYAGTVDGTEMQGFMMALMAPTNDKATICISVAPAIMFNQSNMDQLKLLLRSVTFH